MNVILPEAVNLVKYFELFMPRRYKDKNGVWAIGYGHSENAGTDPHVITDDMVLTEPEAAAILNNDLEIFAKTMRNYIKTDINDYEYGGLLSWYYNTTPKTFRESDVVKLLHSPDVPNYRLKAADAFLKYDIAWDDELKVFRQFLGLRRRRKFESALFEGILQICNPKGD